MWTDKWRHERSLVIRGSAQTIGHCRCDYCWIRLSPPPAFALIVTANLLSPCARYVITDAIWAFAALPLHSSSSSSPAKFTANEHCVSNSIGASFLICAHYLCTVDFWVSSLFGHSPPIEWQLHFASATRVRTKPQIERCHLHTERLGCIENARFGYVVNGSKTGLCQNVPNTFKYTCANFCQNRRTFHWPDSPIKIPIWNPILAPLLCSESCALGRYCPNAPLRVQFTNTITH